MCNDVVWPLGGQTARREEGEETQPWRFIKIKGTSVLNQKTASLPGHEGELF